jgi:membrane-bound lytic murein transglycosylase D
MCAMIAKLRMWFGSMRGANGLNLRCYHCAAGTQQVAKLCEVQHNAVRAQCTEVIRKRHTMSNAFAGEGVGPVLDRYDEWVRMVSGAQRWAVAAACMPLMLLAGCPQQQAGKPGGVAANATAPAIAAPAPVAAPVPAMTQQQAIELATRAQRVQQLIQQAEGAYSSGVNNYRGGRLEAARADFDMAVDLMLTSGMDVKNDPQLADELEHLLDAINTLEMSALKQGTGFSAPIEAAPLDAADEVTFPANAALTAKVEEELKTTQSDFPLVVNDYVAGFINYFSNSPAGHAHLKASLERAGKYKEMISQDVPQDLIYLAVAESGFQPQALNAHSGAGGMWQFMPFQGVYGLTRNAYFDERFDPEKSSKAYARYMKYLYDQFGDWYLAMAAYNWGPGNVQRSVMRTGYADFWELYRRNVLPKDTKNYVPGIIAAIIMAKNPQQYGLEGLVPDAPVISDTVTVDYAVDLRLAADVTDASLQEIVALNPSLLRMSTPGDMDFDLHLPAGTKDVYLKRIAKIPEDKRSSWRFHVVHAGESLDSIASSLHSRASEIVSANGLDANALIQAGDELAVPVAAVAVALRTLHYTTRAGDTLVTVADRFNVSVEDLRRWNHLSSSRIGPHRTLAVSEPVHLAPATHVRAKRARGSVKAKAGAGAKKKGAASTARPSATTSSQSTTKGKTVAEKKRDTSK